VGELTIKLLTTCSHEQEEKVMRVDSAAPVGVKVSIQVS